MKKWYVAYVLSRHEKKTAERLTKMGIENFLPVQEEIRQWAHRRQKVTRVVIPMMIFVHATGTCGSADTLVGEPLHGAEGRTYTCRDSRPADGAFQVYAGL